MKRTATDVTGLMVLGLALCLSGCAITQNAAPVEDRTATRAKTGSMPSTETPSGVEVFPAQNAPLTQQSIEPMESTPMPVTPQAAAPQSPAVVALVDNSDRQAGSGNLDAAAAALERALRIEPRNAGLWQRLADIRLRQNQPGQAESLALKSNTLAVGDNAAQAGNWRIIAKARRVRGDADGARQADSRADALIGRDTGAQ